MRDLLWLLAITVDIVHGHPTRADSFHRRQAISFSGVPVNGSFTNGSSLTASIATGSSASSITFSDSPTKPLPIGTAQSSSSSFESLASTSSSSPLIVSTSSGASTNSSPFFPSASSGLVDSSASLGTLSTAPSAPGRSFTSPITTGTFTNSTVVNGNPPAGTGALGSSSPDSSSSGTGLSPSSSQSTGLSGTGSSATAFLGTGSLGSGASGTGSPSTRSLGTGSSGTSAILTGSSASVSPSGTSPSSTSPAGTITSSASLSTISIASLSTQSTSIAGVTSNTEITTTDKNGHHTILPFLWDCWFCGGGGLLLWGVGPSPGIYPPPAPPPFPSWPIITIGNDDMPTPEPSKSAPTSTSPSGTQTTTSASSSSSSCSGSTVTDYWVSCASAISGTASSCSTYSSSLASGCSVTPATTTTASSCTAPASVDPDSLLPGEVAGPEYDFVDPRVSETQGDPQWSYTVAVVASTGVVGASPGSSPTSGPSTTANITSTTSSSISTSGSSQSVTPSSSQLTTTKINPFPFTTTDQVGDVIVCAGSSLLYIPGISTFTYCDGTNTTVSTATPKPSSTAPPPPPPSPPPPSADCAFQDEGWGWTFEVYNIQSWSTDGGDKLHHEEDGCGALTGWSWKVTDSGGQAQFNLPFFIKDGCVERAIVSAGGPKISCNGQKAVERRRDTKTLRARADVAKLDATPPNFNNATIASAYSPPNVDVTALAHTYKPATWDHPSRSVHMDNDPQERSLLLKRGCGLSKQAPPSPGGNPQPAAPLVCNPIIPGVDECNEQIRAKGNVGPKTSLFYTGWGANGAPSVGGTQARKYASKHMCNMETVSWTGICDGDWRFAVQAAIVQPFKRDGMSSDELFALNEKADPFLKNLAQAFAETSKGDVYVFIPEGQLPGNQWNLDSAWGGWEYPALTANQEVQRIFRVDLDVTDPNDPKGTPDIIWDRSRGDGKANYEPKGIRGPSLPAGLPADQVPDGWNQPGSV